MCASLFLWVRQTSFRRVKLHSVAHFCQQETHFMMLLNVWHCDMHTMKLCYVFRITLNYCRNNFSHGICLCLMRCAKLLTSHRKLNIRHRVQAQCDFIIEQVVIVLHHVVIVDAQDKTCSFRGPWLITAQAFRLLMHALTELLAWWRVAGAFQVRRHISVNKSFCWFEQLFPFFFLFFVWCFLFLHSFVTTRLFFCWQT